MQIARLRIKNFKGLREADYTPTRFGCIVGENNAGKSTVLQALATCLNRPTSLDLSLFYHSDQPVEFRLEVEGITEQHLRRLNEEHRPRIAELIHERKLILVQRYRPGEKLSLSVERLQPIEERYHEEAISEAFKGKRGAAVRAAIEEAYPEFADQIPNELNSAAAKSYVTQRIAELPVEHFRLREAPLPTGISASITALLPEPIYIPAVKNLHDDLKTTQSTSFGRLLGLLLDDMTPDLEEVSKALKGLNSFFNRVERDGDVVDERHEKVRELETNIEELLSENFPNVKIELSVPPPELRAILNSAQILVDDGSKDLIDNKGDGIKRSLTFALLQSWVKRLTQAQPVEGQDAIAPRPMIFLFEEPELYLHPKSQRILFATLERISKQFQVVVTTHSPLFFAPGITASFVRIAKAPAEPKPIGIIHGVNFDLDAGRAECFRLAKFENADAAFFSRRVVLFEGESDDAFLKHVAKNLNPDWDFEAKNVAMVQVSGKGNFSRFRNFFEAFGIEVKVVADLDAFFDGYQHLGANGAAIPREASLQTIDRRIEELGVKAEPATRQIKSRVKSESWHQRYEAARSAIRQAQEKGAVEPAHLDAIDALFVWEADIARIKVCKEDDTSKATLVPCVDALRQQGICVLTKGAIEDYYPNSAPRNGAKPDRALSAIGLVPDIDIARSLSQPLSAGREPELYEICAELFRGI